MRTILAMGLLLVAGVAMGQNCPLCSPGTTPNYYRVTFAGTSDASLNGKTFRFIFKGDNRGGNTWESEWRIAPATAADAAAFDISWGPWQVPVPGPRLTFYHAGFNPTNKKFGGQPGQGFISANVAGIYGFQAGPSAVATAGERDGNGPFVIPLTIGGTATVQP